MERMVSALGKTVVEKTKETAALYFQTAVYGGVPAMNTALKELRTVLTERGLWPLL